MEPPLIISEEDLDRAVQILSDSIGETAQLLTGLL
jgi:4-aminobutyrate aminotransferase-like enzyme